jgi:murein DD-endopeptidase MepM/ murein hydrolase activator NlpD
MALLRPLRGRPARTVALWAGILVVGSFAEPAMPAGAVTKQQVSNAAHQVEVLKQQIAAEQRRLNRLSASLTAITTKYNNEYAQVQNTEQQIGQKQQQINVAQQKYDSLVGQLDDRARQVYMNGPGSDLSFILGSSSLLELSDRLQFVQTISQWNEDLAQQVQNTKNTLVADQKQLISLKAQQVALLNQIGARKQQLQNAFATQQSIQADINHKLQEATAYASKLKKRYAQQIAALTGPSSGLFKYCPVGTPRAISNDFGAPRYTGGFHLHMGDDILSVTGTPIYAPFSGTAASANDPLGGLDVFVYGAAGYVFNAHLSALSANSNGPVSAGTIIGYVGSSGDAAGPHDHFEWHPKVIPQNWPPSPYHQSVIDGAINPYPLLIQACG